MRASGMTMWVLDKSDSKKGIWKWDFWDYSKLTIALTGVGIFMLNELVLGCSLFVGNLEVCWCKAKIPKSTYRELFKCFWVNHLLTASPNNTWVPLFMLSMLFSILSKYFKIGINVHFDESTFWGSKKHLGFVHSVFGF